MDKPTICVECGHMEERAGTLLGGWTGQQFCTALPKRMDYVTGKMYKPKPFCAVRNSDGKCEDFVAKKKENTDE